MPQSIAHALKGVFVEKVILKTSHRKLQFCFYSLSTGKARPGLLPVSRALSQFQHTLPVEVSVLLYFTCPPASPSLNTLQCMHGRSVLEEEGNLPAGWPGITRLLVGNAGGGGSVGGVANMAGWCWCWVCDLREKCEVARLEMERGRAGPEEWCGGIWGERGRCFGRLMLVALLALLLRLQREKDRGGGRETESVLQHETGTVQEIHYQKQHNYITLISPHFLLFCFCFWTAVERVTNLNELLHWDWALALCSDISSGARAGYNPQSHLWDNDEGQRQLDFAPLFSLWWPCRGHAHPCDHMMPLLWVLLLWVDGATQREWLGDQVLSAVPTVLFYPHKHVNTLHVNILLS